MSPARNRALAVAGVVALVVAGVGTFLLTRHDPAADLTAARDAADRREFKAAADLLDKYLTARPADLDARVFAAQVARRRGEAGVMHEHLKAHRQRGGPENARDFELRCVQILEGDMPVGDKLLTDSPDNALAAEAVVLGALAKLRGRSGQMSRFPAGPDDPRVQIARRAVDAWLKLRTGTADRRLGIVWRGRVRAAGGEYDAALKDFRDVLAEDPSHTDARLHLAMTVMQADPSAALDHLRGLREALPDDTDVLTALAEAYRAFARLDDARAVLTEAIGKKPDDVLLMLELALVEIDANRPADAETWAKQVIARAPGLPSGHLAMSRCLALRGDLAGAKKFQDRYDELEILAKRPWRYPKN